MSTLAGAASQGEKAAWACKLDSCLLQKLTSIQMLAPYKSSQDAHQPTSL